MSPEQILAKLGITDVFTISENDTVEVALRRLDEKQFRAAPVVDENGVFRGMFSSHEVIKSLVPSYMLDNDVSLDFAQGTSPVLASRLKKLFPSRVGDHVSSDSSIKVNSNTRTWEALRMLTKYGSPLAIVDASTGVLKGLISDQSAIEALLKMEADEEEFEATSDV